MAVVWRARAIADLARLVNYVSLVNPVAAVRLSQDILLAGDSLLTFPRRGRVGRSGTRELSATSGSSLIYRTDDADQVTVVRVWHAARR